MNKLKDLRIFHQEVEPDVLSRILPRKGDETLWVFAPDDGCSVPQVNNKLRAFLPRRHWHWYHDGRREWEVAPSDEAKKALSDVFANFQESLMRERLLHEAPDDVALQLAMFK
jgi:hypothetical protein